MKTFFLELWGRRISSPPYSLTKRARFSLPKGADTPLTEIVSPSFSLFGVSTPDAFYEGLTKGNVKDGLMNRLLIVDADPRSEKNALKDEIPCRRMSLLGCKRLRRLAMEISRRR
jgi:hypothetical protein